MLIAPTVTLVLFITIAVCNTFLILLFQDRLKDLNGQADSLMASNAFDTSQVKDKRDAINGRFSKIKSMAAGRRAKLNESHRLHQFFRDLDDEESWIKCVLLV